MRSGAVETLLGEDTPRYRLRVSDVERARQTVEEAGLVCSGDDGALVFEGDEARASAAAAACVRAGLDVYELSPVRKTLDELYLSEVNK